MPESYVHPPVRAREPRSERLAVWRFRFVAIVLLAIVALGVVQIYNYLSGSTRQDPATRTMPVARQLARSYELAER